MRKSFVTLWATCCRGSRHSQGAHLASLPDAILEKSPQKMAFYQMRRGIRYSSRYTLEIWEWTSIIYYPTPWWRKDSVNWSYKEKNLLEYLLSISSCEIIILGVELITLNNFRVSQNGRFANLPKEIVEKVRKNAILGDAQRIIVHRWDHRT